MRWMPFDEASSEAMSSLIAWAFGAGVVAAVNPCGFAILPGYIARFLGEDEPTDRRRSALHGVFVGLAVTAGKLSVFAVLAAIILAGSRTIVRVGPWAGAVMGGLLVLIGLWTLAGRALHVRVPVLRVPHATGYQGAYLFGVGYGAASLSCCLPIFIGVFAGIGGGIAGSVAESATLFGAYSLGVAILIVPLFGVTGRLRDTMVVRVRRLTRYAAPLSGVLLTVAGVLLLAAWVPVLNGDLRVSPLVRFVLGWQSWGQRIVLRFGAGFWLALGVAIVSALVLPVVLRRRKGGTSERVTRGSEPVTLPEVRS